MLTEKKRCIEERNITRYSFETIEKKSHLHRR